jgi:hypothetical protein
VGKRLKSLQPRLVDVRVRATFQGILLRRGPVPANIGN